MAIQRERHWARFCVGQMYASLVGREVEHEIVPMFRALGVGMQVWSPLASGFLSGKYTRKDPTGGRGRVSNFEFLPIDKERGYDLIEAMARLAKARKCSVAQLALAWLLSKDWATTILLGASKLSQLEDNLGAVDVKLSADDVKKLDELTAIPPIYPNWFNEKTADAQTRAALGV